MSAFEQIIEKALEISRKRRGYLEEMRRAVQAGDKDSVFALAQKLTGLSNEECHRTDTRLN
jgi:hypothetical protein